MYSPNKHFWQQPISPIGFTVPVINLMYVVYVRVRKYETNRNDTPRIIQCNQCRPVEAHQDEGGIFWSSVPLSQERKYIHCSLGLWGHRLYFI